MSTKRTLSLVVFASLPVLSFGQPPEPATPAIPPPPPTVFSNPRAGHDDPRIGLKPGLYDAGEAASGLERIT